VKGVAPDPGRPDESTGESGVSRGHSSRWSNAHPRRAAKAVNRAKGRTVKKLSRKKKDDGRTAET
jgi:hypothetical protein